MHILQNFYPKHLLILVWAIDLMQNWRLYQRNEAHQKEHPRKSVSKLVIQPSCRKVGQTHGEWQTIEILEDKRQKCGSELRWSDCHTFVSYFHHFFLSPWPTMYSPETWLYNQFKDVGKYKSYSLFFIIKCLFFCIKYQPQKS